ncbi:MAG: hypothetical protein WCG47_03875 [Dermatophilaceae bacterium]
MRADDLRPATGRLPLFCARSCREAFDYERAQLLADIEVLNRALEASVGTYSQRRQVMIELATREPYARSQPG